MSFVSPDFDLFKTLAPSVLITALMPDEKRVGGFIWMWWSKDIVFGFSFSPLTKRLL